MNKTYLGYVSVFSLLAVAYFLFNGFYAFSPTDDGFILANSWRIYNGEVPYRDFIYRFPPLTPYLHAITLWLPENWQFLLGRFFFYMQMAIIIALPAVWAISTRRLKLNIFGLALAAIFFAIAIRNFQPMPWYTVDGLMFSYLGLTLLLFSFSPNRTFFWRLVLTGFGSIAFLLAALCKQPFVFAWILSGIVLIIYSAICHRRSPDTWSKKHITSIQLCYWGSGAAIALGFFLWLIKEGALNAFFSQVAGVAGIDDLIDMGVLHYLRLAPVVFFLLGLGFAVLLFQGAKLKGKSGRLYEFFTRYIEVLIPLGLAILAVVFVIVQESAIGPALFGFFLGTLLMYGVLYFKSHRKSAYEADIIVLYAGIFIVSWAASLSEGANTPVLGLGPAFLIVAIELGRPGLTGQKKKSLMTVVACILSVIIILVNYGYLYFTQPYRDLDRRQLTYNLADIHPKFGLVYTSKLTYARFQEIEKLKAEYIHDDYVKYVIMPDFPIYYFLAGIMNPLSMDWFIRTGPVNKELDARIIRELSERKPLVFLQKEFTTSVSWSKARTKETDAWYTLPYWVAENWEKVGEGEYFVIYRAPELDAGS